MAHHGKEKNEESFGMMMIMMMMITWTNWDVIRERLGMSWP
jgi:hypothetical protein